MSQIPLLIVQVFAPAHGYVVNRPQISWPDKGDVNKDLHNNPVTFEQNPLGFNHGGTEDAKNKTIRNQTCSILWRVNNVFTQFTRENKWCWD